MVWQEKLCEQHSPGALALRVDSAYDPRFQYLMRHIGLP
jgi:hypothetical protein